MGSHPAGQETKALTKVTGVRFLASAREMVWPGGTSMFSPGTQVSPYIKSADTLSSVSYWISCYNTYFSRCKLNENVNFFSKAHVSL